MEQTRTIACSLCGADIEVAMAVGQLVRCPSCNTTFTAPVTDTAAAKTAPSRPTPRPELPQTGAAEPVQETSVPPHLVAPAVSRPIPDEVDENDAPGLVSDSPETMEGFRRPERRKSSSAVYLIYFVCTTVIVGAITAIILLARQYAEGDGDAKDRLAPVADVDERPVRWTDASRFSQRMDRVRVKVARVEYAEVLGKGQDGRVISSNESWFLQVHLLLKNHGNTTRTFKSWYGRLFEARNTEVTAVLTDDQGREYQMMVFSDVVKIKGHVDTAKIEPRGEIEDCLVFAVPEDFDLSTVKYFRLQLPGQAIGATGNYRFQIPVSMFKGS